MKTISTDAALEQATIDRQEKDIIDMYRRIEQYEHETLTVKEAQTDTNRLLESLEWIAKNSFGDIKLVATKAIARQKGLVNDK
jgi:uncharacterized protein YjaG (DUF416 family)